MKSTQTPEGKRTDPLPKGVQKVNMAKSTIKQAEKSKVKQKADVPYWEKVGYQSEVYFKAWLPYYMAGNDWCTSNPDMIATMTRVADGREKFAKRCERARVKIPDLADWRHQMELMDRACELSNDLNGVKNIFHRSTELLGEFLGITGYSSRSFNLGIARHAGELKACLLALKSLIDKLLKDELEDFKA
jgi:hypothetical protein